MARPVAIEIRRIEPDEYEGWSRTITTAFGEDVTPEELALYRRTTEIDRAWAAIDGTAIVGTTAAYSFRLAIPGGEVPAAGVTAVGVLPSHRRRGLMRRLLSQVVDDARTHGEPVAILMASEGAIYQRFGYGLASLKANLEVSGRPLGFEIEDGSEGALRMLDRDDALRTLPPVYERAIVPGFISRTDEWWATILDDSTWRRGGAGPRHMVVHEVGGETRGYVLYRIREEWDHLGSRGRLEVGELIALTPRSELELWKFVLAFDLISTVRYRNAPVDCPLLLQVSDPRRLAMTIGDGLWLQFMDVGTALLARSYAGSDSIVLDLSDDLPGNAGRWRLDTGGDRVRAEKTEAPPDVALAARDLASLYLGAFNGSDLVRATRAREIVPGAAARLDAMFATPRDPWLPGGF
jgi:predicted acetyltransferase